MEILAFIGLLVLVGAYLLYGWRHSWMDNQGYRKHLWTATWRLGFVPEGDSLDYLDFTVPVGIGIMSTPY